MIKNLLTSSLTHIEKDLKNNTGLWSGGGTYRSLKSDKATHKLPKLYNICFDSNKDKQSQETIAVITSDILHEKGQLG